MRTQKKTFLGFGTNVQIPRRTPTVRVSVLGTIDRPASPDHLFRQSWVGAEPTSG
jgi:hypothetical protein